MLRYNLDIQKARNISIVEYLKRTGHSPKKENQREAWFLSPVRTEKIPSFKVSKVMNRWYDHGAGKGGNIIDLVIEMNHNCSFKDALLILDKTVPSFSFQQQNQDSQKNIGEEIKIEKVTHLRHPALINYLIRRKINPREAIKYAKQVHYSIRGTRYFGIGIENVSGGWELRNPYYKNGSSPKDVSIFSTRKPMLSLTEGMFDFFSLITLYPDLPQKSDFLVLNSVSFVNRVIAKVETIDYHKIGLYLDNDMAGIKATQKLLADLSNCVDMSAIYCDKKDLNEHIMASRKRSRGVKR